MGSDDLFQLFLHARKKVRWLPLVTGGLLIVVHFIIESNYVSYWPYPQERSPLLLNLSFKLLFWVTFLLGLTLLPRWQSFIALLVIGFVILSIGGR
jgi:hypothetical protein